MRRDVTLPPFCRGGAAAGVNVLKLHLRVTIQTLLRNGTSQHEIQRLTGVDRKTIRRYGQEVLGPPAIPPGVATGSQPGETAISELESPPPRPPASPPRQARSGCAAHREWIQAQVQLGRNAVSIYQDLVETHGFTHRYNSVKRFVRTLKLREPERFDVLESRPGEEAQVDFGMGALTRCANGTRECATHEMPGGRPLAYFNGEGPPPHAGP